MPGKSERSLLVIADDLGIGPNSTRGILELGRRGIVTGTVLIVNSPYAPEAVRQWRAQGCVPEVGWHPNLTLDTPIASPAEIPSLVRPDGSFWPLADFLKRWLFGQIRPGEVALEWRLQWQRFAELIGHPPLFVNCHQHLGIFAPLGDILLTILDHGIVKPYFRRVQEPWNVVWRLPGARLKRLFLGWLGRSFGRLQASCGFPGNDWLAGIANPRCIEDPAFFVRWLRTMPGNVVELMCHPGHHDPTLVGRDCTLTDGILQQRVNELNWLGDAAFVRAVADAGFRLARPSEFGATSTALARSA